MMESELSMYRLVNELSMYRLVNELSMYRLVNELSMYRLVNCLCIGRWTSIAMHLYYRDVINETCLFISSVSEFSVPRVCDSVRIFPVCPNAIIIDQNGRVQTNYNIRVLSPNGRKIDTSDPTDILDEDRKWSAPLFADSFIVRLDLTAPCATQWYISSVKFSLSGVDLFSVQIGTFMLFDNVSVSWIEIPFLMLHEFIDNARVVLWTWPPARPVFSKVCSDWWISTVCPCPQSMFECSADEYYLFTKISEQTPQENPVMCFEGDVPSNSYNKIELDKNNWWEWDKNEWDKNERNKNEWGENEWDKNEWDKKRMRWDKNEWDKNEWDKNE